MHGPNSIKRCKNLTKSCSQPRPVLDLFPVFFRLDLLRIIAAVEAITTNQTENFVYADLDMVPLSKDQLFDKHTVQHLQQYGTVMPTGCTSEGFENGFFILSNHNANMLEALTCAQIELNLERSRVLLNYKNMLKDYPNNKQKLSTFGDSPYNIQYCLQGCIDRLKQLVYDSYTNMFHYFFHLEGLGTMMRSDKPFNQNEIRQLLPFCQLVSPRLGNRIRYSFETTNKLFCNNF